jgi:O-antigen/teichoic acid export membrane protein
MEDNSNKKIVKNTLYLYLRMGLTIIVNLYTMRLVWQILGVEDYGIYNVVGGIIIMFSFINAGMVAASQRFISYELGNGTIESIKKVFNISLRVHIIIACVVIIVSESIGLWFLNYKMNIPDNRIVAANFVFQCSLISFIFYVISVPYNASIVAHERMKAYGYFGIVEVFMKLIITFALFIFKYDKLITYSILTVICAFIMRIISVLYCNRNFKECQYYKTNDHNIMKSMFAFAGWSFIGNMGFAFRDQGLNILLNMFFNVTINAAKGIAFQVGNVINGFSQSFLMAINPQITKRYAKGEIDSMLNLCFAGCRYSFYLISLIVIPFFYTASEVLSLWLTEVAPYTTDFLKLSLILVLIDSCVGPITTSLQATGRIKYFQIFISILMISNIPLSWFLLKYHNNPLMVMYVSISVSVIAFMVRVILLRREFKFRYVSFFRGVVLRIIICGFLCFGANYICNALFRHYFEINLLQILIYSTISLIINLGIIYIIGINKIEKNSLIKEIKRRLCLIL